ncbi:MAG: asparagine synthase (glutamine-hydrolyzing) [Planctomycetia bacterium]|nr:asparagine synthase (glutamine-hydrolyzing) [Planctomycetia bacterium]
MCGIVAMFSRNGPVDTDALKRGMQSLVHRGPDGQRHWVAPHGRVALGHTRLSIIDLVTGDQPIANENERLHVIVNGEFYDYERIQRELVARGHRLRTQSDSEIALHLYEDYGAHALRELRGEFAIVLWDEPSGMLLAVRDRFGVKPLYYAQLGDTLYLASEAKALFAAGVPARWDHESFFQIAHVYFDQDRSLFAGVRQVPPGCYLLATREHAQIVRYWDFDYPRADAPADNLSDHEHVERMRHTLDEAVRIRLRADVPVGCYLSGGLDSCALLGMAAVHRSDPIEAFTLCFDVEPYNEELVAKEMAAHARANFHPLPITQTELADNFFDCIWHSETLAANAHGVAKFLLSEKVRDHGFKVVLTGEGSDEILGGYAHFRRDMLLYGSSGQDPKEVERLLTELADTNEVSRGVLLPSGEPLPMDSVRRALGFVPSWLEVRSANSMRYRRLFRPEFMAAFADRDPFRVFLNRFDIDGQLTGRQPVNQSLYLWTKTMLANYLLNMLGDRMEMAHSIEGRVPFLDHKVVELVRDMPVAMKIRGMTEKYVLREAARPFVTDTIYRRQKHPFLAPPSGLEQTGRLSQLMEDTLRGPIMQSQPFFEPKAVIGLLDRMPSLDEQKRAGASYILTYVLSACVLHQRYGL